MATIADANLGAGWRTLLCTGDKDLLAAAHDEGGGRGTFILNHHAGSYHALGPEQVLNKMGVPPHRVALYKAIAGDPGDNIPGGRKMGPVAARRLAGSYASVRQLFKHLDRLQSSDRRGLEASGLEHMLLQERLTTLRFDAPLVAV